ncbi:Uncharacterised protein [Niallia circulans]|jgi:hypothetical protein|uniref:hypothetical protein n=1 Tax=Niallia circulans TaxID=1397 RepID=UPI00077C9C66|nr:hypothetical protein [Niallia circulans]PAD24002.1 hypothetical protein CHH62_19510 [Niallia circulans]SPT82999.1 Uncharacterised protein [Niallia circulans]
MDILLLKLKWFYIIVEGVKRSNGGLISAEGAGQAGSLLGVHSASIICGGILERAYIYLI